MKRTLKPFLFATAAIVAAIISTAAITTACSPKNDEASKTCTISFPEPPVKILDAKQAGKQVIGYFNIIQPGDNNYLMYYIALEEGAEIKEFNYNLYIAHSDDLINWKTERPGGGSDLIMNSVIEQSVCYVEGDEYPYRLIGNIFEDDKYKMCMWFSKDGVEFGNRTIVMEDCKHDSQSVLVLCDGYFRLYFRKTIKLGPGNYKRMVQTCKLDMDGKLISEPVFAADEYLYNSAASKLSEASDLLLPTYFNNAPDLTDTCYFKAFVQTGDKAQEIECPLNKWVAEDEKWVIAAPGIVSRYGRNYIAYNVRNTSHDEGRIDRSEFKLIEISIDSWTAPALVAGARKRLVAMDLDATLTQHKTPLSDTNTLALNALAERYHLLMVGGGGAERIHRQMNDYPIDILGNYGMQEARVTPEGWTIIRSDTTPVDSAAILAKCQALREKYGYTKYYGEPVEFHPSGMITFGLLGTKAPSAEKLLFDPDKSKRRAMYKEVCEVFSDFSVFIGGSTSFDLTAKEYNKYDAVMRYAAENGYSRDEIIFIGDDLDDGGNDSHVRLGGMDYIRVYDYRKFPEYIAPLLK